MHQIGYSCCVAIYTVLRSSLRERDSLAPKERGELKMAAYIGEVINLLSDDDSKGETTSSPLQEKTAFLVSEWSGFAQSKNQ